MLFYETNGQPSKFPHPIGYYMLPTGIDGMGVTTIGSNSGNDYMTLTPFVVSEPMTLSQLAVAMTTAGSTGAQCELALYFNDPGTNQPGQQIGYCGTVPLTVGGTPSSPFVGAASFNIGGTATPVNVGPGVYWLACALKCVGITTMPTLARVAGFAGGMVPLSNNLSDLTLSIATRGYFYAPSGFTCGSNSGLNLTGLLTSQSNLASNVVNIHIPVVCAYRSA